MQLETKRDYSEGDVIPHTDYCEVTLIDFDHTLYALESRDSLVQKINLTALKEERMMSIFFWDEGDVKESFVNIDSIITVEHCDDQESIEINTIF